MRGTRRIAIALCFTLLIASILTGCREQKKPVKLGQLIIVSEPTTDAVIFLNGKKQPIKTNAVFKNAKVGRYRIELEKPSSTESSASPEIGSAEAVVTAGKTTKVVITLNKMTIIPTAASDALRAKTRAQKAILDFFDALTVRDWQRAYGHLSLKGRAAYRTSFRFSRTWEQTAGILVGKIDMRDQKGAGEVNGVRFDLSFKPLPNEESSTRTVEAIISTFDDGRQGLPRIDAITDASGAPFLPRR